MRSPPDTPAKRYLTQILWDGMGRDGGRERGGGERERGRERERERGQYKRHVEGREGKNKKKEGNVALPEKGEIKGEVQWRVE